MKQMPRELSQVTKCTVLRAVPGRQQTLINVSIYQGRCLIYVNLRQNISSFSLCSNCNPRPPLCFVFLSSPNGPEANIPWTVLQ